MPATSENNPTQFVILHHQLADGEHWDLMLEQGGRLLTWQLPKNPLAVHSLPMAARRIPDHRTLYLTYEGSISGDRGFVTRIAMGWVEILEWTGANCRFRTFDSDLAGEFQLQATDDAWTLRTV